MPAVKARDTLCSVLIRDMSFVEGVVVRMFELGFGEAFVIINCAVSDKLDLRLARNSFEIGV